MYCSGVKRHHGVYCGGIEGHHGVYCGGIGDIMVCIVVG